MAIRWVLSNDLGYSSATLHLRDVTSAIVSAGYFVNSRQMFQISNGQALPSVPFGAYMRTTLNAVDTWLVNWRMTLGTVPAAIDFVRFSGTNGTAHQLYLAFDANSRLVLKNSASVVLATGTTPVPWGNALGNPTTVPDRLFYIEVFLHTHPVDGFVTIKLNSRLDLVYQGNTGSVSIDTFQWGNVENSCYYNDFVIADTTGTANNSWLGDLRVDSCVPNVNGTYQELTRSNTGVNAWTLVDDVGNTDTDYVYSQVNGARSTFGVDNLSHSPLAVQAVVVRSMARKVDPATTQIRNMVRSSLTDATGDYVELGTAQEGNATVFEIDPATGVAWTVSGVNALEAGVQIDTSA